MDIYKRNGSSISGLLKAAGKENRYILDNVEENTITMGFNATKKLLNNVNIRPQDITLLVFSSG